MVQHNSLAPEIMERMRMLVEGSVLPFRTIAAELGTTGGTVSRLARQHGWQRPAGAPLNGDALRHQRAEQKRQGAAGLLLNTLYRQAAALDAQGAEPSPAQVRSVTLLSSALQRIAPQRPGPPPVALAPPPAPDDEPPPRPLNELRDELFAHLSRISAEEEALTGRSFAEEEPEAAPGMARDPARLDLVDGAGI